MVESSLRCCRSSWYGRVRDPLSFPAIKRNCVGQQQIRYSKMSPAVSILWHNRTTLLSHTIHHPMHCVPCRSQREARFVVGQVTLAIGLLHGLGIVHRDVKPENILLYVHSTVSDCSM